MRPRGAEARITDLATERRRYVSVRVAAAYLEVDVRTFRKYLASGLLASVPFGERQRVEVAELHAFENRQRAQKVR